MSVSERESALEQLRNLLAQGVADDADIDDGQDDDQEPVAPDPHAETRKLLEQIVELARRPVDLTGIAAPQVTVQPASVHLPAPTVHVEAPNVTVQAPAAASAIPWTFEFERFPNGTIKAIHATPKTH